MLRRSPGFSLLAILCLTLGIGANAAVFSWIEGILFRPFPLVANQDRMFALTGTTLGVTGRDDVSWPDFLDVRKHTTLFDAFIVDRIMGTTLNIGDKAEVATGSVVSANYFDVLGVHPILGRGFEPTEETGRNAHPVTVISYRAWQDRYHGDPNIIGKTQRLNNVMHTIIGVAPDGFYGTFVGYEFQFWVPASMQELFTGGGFKLEDRGERWIEGFAFLKPGVTRQQAQDEISNLAKRLENDYPATNRGRGLQLWPLWRTPFNQAGNLLPTLEISFAVVIFVLLIACANVGNLLLVRSFARRHEMTVRLAIGCGRGRLLRQLLTEGLILSALAAVGGLLVAHWCRNAVVMLFPRQPAGIVIHLPGEIDWRVLAVSAGVCLISTVLFALVPAIQAGKIDLAGALKAESGGVVGGRGKARIRSSLVLVQVSLSFILLVATGLLMEGLQRMRNTSPGFAVDGLLASSVDLFSAGYDAQRAKNFHDELIARLQAVPLVQSVAFGRRPFTYPSYLSAPIAVSGYQIAPDEQPAVDYTTVGPGYFSTMGIPIVSGREFTRLDIETAPLVAIVNEPMAVKYWRGRDPVGDKFQMKGRWVQVVGVAKLSKYRTLQEVPQPLFYVPMRQFFSISGSMLIRTTLSTKAMAAVLMEQVHAIDPELSPTETITMREQVERMGYTQGAAVKLLSVFGGMALLLAAVGLYGVMSYVVSQSTRELGLRMALGAGVSDLIRLVMSNGLALTAGGIVLGAAAALGLTRLMGNLLYKVSPRDPLAFGVALLVMTVVSLAACFLPAWRASRTDPVRALRD
jgi:predicted permease